MNFLSVVDSNARFLSSGTVRQLDPSGLSKVRSSIPKLLSVIPTLSNDDLSSLRSSLLKRISIYPSLYSSCYNFIYLIDLLLELPVPSLNDLVSVFNAIDSQIFSLDFIDKSSSSIIESISNSNYDGVSLKSYSLSSDLQVESAPLYNLFSPFLRTVISSYSIFTSLPTPYSLCSSFTGFTSYAATMGVGDKLSPHLHPNSVVVSTFYPLVELQVAGDACLRFFLPTTSGKLLLSSISFSPKSGDIFCFPAWLYHDTSVLSSPGTRLCINSDAYFLQNNQPRLD